MEMHLVVVRPFGGLARGDAVTDGADRRHTTERTRP